ncbi:hypothetical protein [Terriglobus tenax]|uniref:hypothetical protein n=1 Tax=Terriglobus tenax TaxID=1111115 RepID=UPI0021DF7345|nr:hypothetical protein [Terriglobus tenax]
MLFYGFFMLLPLFAILFLLYMLMTKQNRRPHMYNQPRTEYPQTGRANGSDD